MTCCCFCCANEPARGDEVRGGGCDGVKLEQPACALFEYGSIRAASHATKRPLPTQPQESQFAFFTDTTPHHDQFLTQPAPFDPYAPAGGYGYPQGPKMPLPART